MVSVIRVFEFLQLKNKSEKKAYTSIKKIRNILSDKDFNLISHNTKQFFPFKMLTIGNFINSIMELLMAKFNLGIKNLFFISKTR